MARDAEYSACARAATAGVTTHAQQPGAKFQTSIRPAHGQNTAEQSPAALHRHGYGANTDVPAANQTLRGAAAALMRGTAGTAP